MRVLRRRPVAVVSALAMLGTGAMAVVPVEAQQEDPPGVGLEVYVGEVDAAGVESMREMGLDAHGFIVEQKAGGATEVEVVLSEAQAAKLSDAGVDLEVKQVDGVDASEALEAQAAAGMGAVPLLQRTRWDQGRDPGDGRGQRRPHQGRGHR